jgi:predicted hydrocarbon binding protein
MEHSTAYAQSEHISHSLIEGAQEMLGFDRLQLLDLPLAEAQLLPQNGSRAVQPGDSPFSLAGLPFALEQRYGAVGGRGLALRIGRSAFKYLLQRRGEAMGLTSVDFRLQRAPQRMMAGLHLLAHEMITASHDQIAISETDGHWVWRSERCPVCWGRHTGAASCYLTVGLIQEFLAWAGGGRYYRVMETECRAAGSATCSFWVEKKPLD